VNLSQTPFVPKGSCYRDLEDKRLVESRNGVIQAEFVLYTASNWRPGDRLTPELLRELQRLAVTQIYRCAGHFRDGPVSLQGARHAPPDHTEVPMLVDEMCAYVNTNWGKPPVHLCAYLMWRVNWIHPFFGGNGRTSRAVSYLVLCAALGFQLPGDPTIPDLIVADRDPYYDALRKADAACDLGKVDVSAMEDLMGSLLAKQLLAIHDQATGRMSQPDATSR
jgi:Fic family protein